MPSLCLTCPLHICTTLCHCVSMPCYTEAIHVHANALPLRNLAVQNHCFALRYITIQCQNTAFPCYAQALFISALPMLYSSYLGQCLSNQCLYFTMPVLTSRCSASAIRFLSLPQRNVTYPRLCSAYLRSAIAPLIPASPLLINAFHCHNVALLSRSSSYQLRYVALPCFAFSRRFTTLALVKHFPLKSTFAGIAPLAQTVIASEVEPIHDTANQLATCHDVKLDIRSCRARFRISQADTRPLHGFRPERSLAGIHFLIFRHMDDNASVVSVGLSVACLDENQVVNL